MKSDYGQQSTIKLTLMANGGRQLSRLDGNR
jgi:hypothetical protein